MVRRSTVQRCLERLKSAGLSWPLPADLDDVALERRLFPPPPVASPAQRCLPDCAAIHKELKSRKNVTLQLLWEEYKQANPLCFIQLPESIAAMPAANSSQDQHVGPHLQRIELVVALHLNPGKNVFAERERCAGLSRFQLSACT
jgi:hypothetical protein